MLQFRDLAVVSCYLGLICDFILFFSMSTNFSHLFSAGLFLPTFIPVQSFFTPSLQIRNHIYGSFAIIKQFFSVEGTSGAWCQSSRSAVRKWLPLQKQCKDFGAVCIPVADRKVPTKALWLGEMKGAGVFHLPVVLLSRECRTRAQPPTVQSPSPECSKTSSFNKDILLCFCLDLIKNNTPTWKFWTQH